jgi:hypothetical protein
MPETFRFVCAQCGETHEGLPGFSFPYPMELNSIPQSEWPNRVALGSDACVIDHQWFFVLAQLELPMRGSEEALTYGVWVSVSEASFETFQRTFEQRAGRENEEPLFAWLTAVPPPFPRATLKSRVHLRPYPERPWLELEPTEHPAAVAQREGLSRQEVVEIAQRLLHQTRWTE